ncbi:MAG: aminoglycoside phosphotransferase family protein, partial [Varibaculum sp.]|nr:aminoglycoside phosphotransferase family protein [Varibaculum sp.]
MEPTTTARVFEAIANFQIDGEVVEAKPYGSGHINDTLRVCLRLAGGVERLYTLQRINTDIFTDPAALMDNIAGVTDFLREIITAEGGNPERETLRIIRSHEGLPYYLDSAGSCWRMYSYIDHAYTLDQIENPESFYQSGLGFGNFQRRLADYPAETLHETIPRFHDTVDRLRLFEEAVERDTAGHVNEITAEIDFVRAREEFAHRFVDLQAQGELPLRVTHNDTKLNNVLLDEATGQALAVIDLDTVMPGLAMNDFGDSIRFGASTGAEDEPDLDKVSCSMEYFEAFTRGFMTGVAGRLTDLEIELLPVGAQMMTFECGTRFLTDYIDG